MSQQKLTVVYALTIESEKNLYIEQCALSQASLKIYNPDCTILTVVCHDTYRLIFDSKKNEYTKAGNLLTRNSLIKVIECPAEFTAKERSRFLKLSIRNKIDGDFLFLDTDTIICDDLSPIMELDCHVAMCQDLNLNRIENKIILHDIKEKYSLAKLDFNWNSYFNSGVYFAKDTKEARYFFDFAFKTWCGYRTKSFCFDQIAINYANQHFSGIIKELSGEWNCQVQYFFIRYLHNAKIIHYFNEQEQPFYGLADKAILERINQLGDIPQDTVDLIKNAKSLFPSDYVLTKYKDLQYNPQMFKMPCFKFLLKLKEHKILLKIVNKMLIIFSRFSKNPLNYD